MLNTFKNFPPHETRVLLADPPRADKFQLDQPERVIQLYLTNKDGKLYNAWVQLDFKETENNGNFKIKQFSEKYGFELEKALSKHPIKELGDETEKSRLIESLQKGNRQAVTFYSGRS